MPKKQVQTQPSHPIFSTCIWRFPRDLTTEQKIAECEKCYKSQTETTEYCRHMVEYGNKAMLNII